MKNWWHSIRNCCFKKAEKPEPEKLAIEADGHNQKVMEEAMKTDIPP